MLVKASSVVVLLTVFGLSGAVAAAGKDPLLNERLDLTLVKRTSGTTYDHKGRASGGLVGTATSKITITHSVLLKGVATIKTPSGTVRMRIDGRAKSLGIQAKFIGDSTIVGGTGRYKDAKGKGKFTGVVNRNNWHATIRARGTFTY